MSVKERPTGEAPVPALESRYDWLLALLPLPLLCGVAVASLTPAPSALGVGLGGVPSVLLLAYGLFVDPPLAE